MSGSDAMSRAREIAAKLRGGFSDTGPPPEKRRRGGFSDGPPAGKPHLADIAAAAAAAVRERLSGGPPQPKQSQGGDHYGPGRSTHIAEPAVALPTAQKFLFTDEPGMEFELKELHVALACSAQPITSTKIFTPEDGLTNYMGLVLGPKGSSLKQMQEKYRCKIVVRGRGIQRGGAFDPDPSPDDDLPMHVSVTGPQDAVQFLEKEYHAMFTNAEKRREVKQRQMDTMVSGETAGTQLALRDGALVVASSSGDNWRVIPSAPRPGEKDGVHYNCVDKAQMEAGIARGEFIEWAKVHTNMYGTSVAAVQAVAVHHGLLLRLRPAVVVGARAPRFSGVVVVGRRGCPGVRRGCGRRRPGVVLLLSRWCRLGRRLGRRRRRL